MSNDNQLQDSVIAELNWEPSIKAAHIGVAANGGVVTLSGHVDTYREKSEAENAARRVRGVKAVAEEIEVRLAFDGRRTDEEIATVATNYLEWDAGLPQNVIQIKVENGGITLFGEVDWHYQLVAAERAVRGLQGVVGVCNAVTIKPRVDEKNIGADIRHALHRGWFDPKTINVSAEGGNIHLTGTARSWQERQLAGATAWASRGATGVQNDLRIL